MAVQLARTDSDETRIRELLENWVKAARAKDVAGVMAHYAPDLLAFDAVGKLQFEGAQAYREHWDACMEMCPGPMIYEVHELGITAQDELAFCHYLARCGGTGPDGNEQVGWTRVTVCFRKIGGRWAIVHEHFSAPFDPESGKALLDLEP